MLNAIAALIGALSVAEAQTVPLPVVLPDSARIELTLEKSERRDEGPWQRHTFSYDVLLDRPDADGLRLMTWRLREVDGVALGPDTLGRLEMTVDATLTPVRLENLAELTSAARRMIEEGGEEAPDNAIAALAMLTPEGAALFASDATLIAMGQGTDLYLGEDNAYELEGALPWGDQPVTMIGRYLLETLDQEAGRATISWEQTIDPESLLAALPSMITAMAAAGGGGLEDQASVQEGLSAATARARMENRRECRFEIEISTGLAGHVDCSSRILLEAEGQRETRESLLRATQRLIP